MEHKTITWNNGYRKYIDEPKTVGELKQALSLYDDNTPFWFRNQPMQALYEVKYGKDKCVVFQ